MEYKDPKVEIIAATEKDPLDAAALLIFTKHTRLEMSPTGLADIRKRVGMDWTWAESELNYMAKTIRSSWEFLDVTFAIMNVSRACAQQITRTRFVPMEGDIFGSYSMQSQRVTDMSGASAHMPEGLKSQIDPGVHEIYVTAMDDAMSDYASLIGSGASPEDARGVLPMNLHCNLIMKINLRNLVDLVSARTSYRAQGEYRDVATQMRAATVALWPWSETFFRPRNEIALDLLSELSSFVDSHLSVARQEDVRHLKLLAAKVRDQIEGK